jgi:flavin-dependent dehydrogenase
MNSLIKDNVIITGDAARLAHSLSGGGIRNAIISGSFAGNIASRYIQGEIQSLEPHHDYMRKKISGLNKEYFFKSKAIKNENSYLTLFKIGISIAYIVNRLLPNLLEKIFIKLLEREEPIF